MAMPWEEYGGGKPTAAPAPAPWDEYAAPKGGKELTRTDKVLTGMADPIHGGAQLLTKMLPDSVVKAGNSLNNWIADKTGMVARLPEGGVDQAIRQREQQYQADRAASDESGIDGYRMLGNVVSPANLALASRLPAAASLAGRVATGAAGGAAASAMAPVTDGDFTSEKGKQLLGGAIGGAAVPAVTGGIARVISPNASTNPQVQALRAEGVRPTIGQALGGMANTAEQKLMSVPVVGDAIASARRGAAADLNTAAFNRALAPINQRLPQGLTGRDAVQHVDDAISAGYNRLLPQLTARADQQFNTQIAGLRQMVSTGAMDPRSARAFERILQNDVLSKFGGAQSMTGETLKRVESDLGQQISRLAQSTDADQRLVGDALQQVQAEIRQLLVRSNPSQAQTLRSLNTAWANFKRVQRASSGLGADDGVFSPAQLQSAVKAMDRSKDKARFAEGRALMQDLSEPGRSVLGNQVPDSGTAGRLLLGGGASLLDPTMTAPVLLGGGALMYSRPMQGLLSGAVSARPQSAQAAANAVRQASPFLIPLGSQVGLGLLN
jgi:hypothetical protein